MGNINTVDIFDLSNDCVGVAKIDDKIVFVKDAITGDTVVCDIYKAKKNYSLANIKEITTPSKDRVTPKCKHFGVCGGCKTQHMSNDLEHTFKQNVLETFVTRNFSENTKENAREVEENNYAFYNYRNKAVFHCEMQDDTLVAGFYKEGSNDLVIVDCCDLISEKMQNAVNTLVEKINEQTSIKLKNNTKHILVRESRDSILVDIIVDKKRKTSYEDIRSIVNDLDIDSVVVHEKSSQKGDIIGRKLGVIKGDGFIKDSINGFDFKISADTFFQVNREITAKMYDYIGKMLKDENVTTLVDGYAGVGTFAITLSEAFSKVIAVEVVESAHDNGIENAELNGCENIEFINDRFENVIEDIVADNKDISLILDPPRKGCDESAIEIIKDSGIDTIVYVSCDLKGFRHDMEILKSSYDIVKYKAFNMFCKTKEFESVFLLKKKN